MWLLPQNHPLRRMFAGVTEHTFMATLGVTDTQLIDYLSDLLSRFLHIDDLYRLRDTDGRPIVEVVDMLLEVQKLPKEGRTAREFHRHVGDFTLFWTGIFPETLERRRTPVRKDSFVDYCAQGKRSYFLASTFDDEKLRDESRVLRRLSNDFELCAYGLTQVRREWERK